MQLFQGGKKRLSKNPLFKTEGFAWVVLFLSFSINRKINGLCSSYGGREMYIFPHGRTNGIIWSTAQFQLWGRHPHLISRNLCLPSSLVWHCWCGKFQVTALLIHSFPEHLWKSMLHCLSTVPNEDTILKSLSFNWTNG